MGKLSYNDKLRMQMLWRLPLPGLRRTAEPVRSTRLQVATENAGPENAGLENDGLEFDGPEQRAVMSLVQEHMHTLKTVPDFLKLIFYRRSTDLFMLVFNGHVRFVILFNLHYTNLVMIMTKVHNILSKINKMNSIEQFLAHSLIMVLNVS